MRELKKITLTSLTLLGLTMQLSAANSVNIAVEGTERSTLKASVKVDFSINKFGGGTLALDLDVPTTTRLKNVNMQGGTVETAKSIGTGVNFNGASTLRCTGDLTMPAVAVNAPAQVLVDAARTATLSTVTGSSSFTKIGLGTIAITGDSAASGGALTSFNIVAGAVDVSNLGKLPTLARGAVVSVGTAATGSVVYSYAPISGDLPNSIPKLILENTVSANVVPGGLTVHNGGALQLGTSGTGSSPSTYQVGTIAGGVSCEAGSIIELASGATCPDKAFASLHFDNNALLYLRDGSVWSQEITFAGPAQASNSGPRSNTGQ